MSMMFIDSRSAVEECIIGDVAGICRHGITHLNLSSVDDRDLRYSALQGVPSRQLAMPTGQTDPSPLVTCV